MNYLSFDTTISIDLEMDGNESTWPLECFFIVGQPEPDVGLSSHYIEDMYLEVRGKRAKWLERRLSFEDWNNLEEKALEEYHNAN